LDSVALAHARLSLVGVSNGSQPIANESGLIHAVVNGEFYGYREIRRTLESKGHQFRTESDSEVLVHLYEQHGLKCLDHLRGEFAFVLWDEQQQQLVAARDRFGVKPLVFTVNGSKILLASEAKALLPEVPSQWDHESMFFASAMQYLPSHRTLFANIQQLPPGHTLIFNTTEMRIQCYWDFDLPESSVPADQGSKGSAGQTLEEATYELRGSLKEAVCIRLHGDAPVCFHLSGGLDSSAVLGLATHLTGQPQHAFTLAFEDAGYDESELAQDTAKFCNAIWHPVRVTRQDVLAVMTEAVISSEGLAINGHLSAKYLLNREIHNNGFRAVLSGEGADELFAGYAHLRLDYWRSKNLCENSEQFTSTNSSQIGMTLPSGQGLSLRAADKILGYQPVFLQAKATLGMRLRSLMHDEFLAHWASQDPCEGMLRQTCIPGQINGRSDLQKSTWL